MSDTIEYKGVNLAGLEFGGTGGKLWYNYAMPGAEHYEYWSNDVGANITRIPFKWERLQKETGGELDTDYLNLLLRSVEHANNNGMTAILDMHNFGNYFGKKIGSADVSVEDFADVWTKLGTALADKPNVWLNLMNEPNGFVAETWADYTQEVVDTLRAAGIENKLLLSGTAWSGAHSWVKSGNAAAYEDFVDPMNNFAFDVHQYLDQWSTGTNGKAVDGIGSTALVAATQWAEQHGFELFLGEIGAADPTVAGQEHALSELQDLFNYMEAHGEAWLGWTLWGAGPWWPESYHFEINPTGIKTDNPIHEPVIEQLLPYFEIEPHNEPLMDLAVMGASVLDITANDDGEGDMDIEALVSDKSSHHYIAQFWQNGSSHVTEAHLAKFLNKTLPQQAESAHNDILDLWNGPQVDVDI